MPDLNGRELLKEWREVMDSVVSSAASAAGRSELPRDLVRASQRQLELVQNIIDSEQRLQGDVVGTIFAPVDAVFDMLQQTGATLRRQAEALEAAGRALEETAGLMKGQAELFERMVATLRQPSDMAKAAAGSVRRPGRRAAQAAGAAPQGEPARETHKPSPKAKPQRAKPSAKRNAKPS
ncbi:MAG TPA: hypothetical protein VF380_07120 [Solirubrobacteraceae bacterium]